MDLVKLTQAYKTCKFIIKLSFFLSFWEIKKKFLTEYLFMTNVHIHVHKPNTNLYLKFGNT